VKVKFRTLKNAGCGTQEQSKSRSLTSFGMTNIWKGRHFYARPSVFWGLEACAFENEAASLSESETGVVVGSGSSGWSKMRRPGMSSLSALRRAASWRSMEEMLPRRSWAT
jgi:hypothetical protein